MLKTQCVSAFAVIKRLFKSEAVRRRIAANHLGIILALFVLDMHVRGYARSGIRHHTLVIEHFGRWLKHQRIPFRRLSTFHIHRFVRQHLPQCHCPRPAPKPQSGCRAALGRFVEFLRREKRIKHFEARPSLQGPVDQLVGAYDRHMEQVCGLSEVTRRVRQVGARRFLRWRFGREQLRLGQLQLMEVRRFVVWRARQLGPTGIRKLASDLRSFLRFLEFTGRLRSGLAEGVPQPVRALPPPPPETLDRKQCRRFLNSFPRSTPFGRRDYAIALCLSELALRSEEVAGLTLDDLDWREMTVRLAQTKQRRQRLLPLPDRVARAVVNYLKQGRPLTRSRALFVHHLAPVGQALTAQWVRKLVRRAFVRCGIEPKGTYILRHTWATWAHRRGAGLKLIADLLGHRSLGSTTRYAHVNLEELRRVALPWPRTKR